VTPLRIAQLAPPLESVPPRAYGGTERVVATLTDELVRRGHEVTLFAAGDSRTTAQLVPTVPHALWHQNSLRTDFAAQQRDALDRIHAALAKSDFDVVHSHLDSDGFGLADVAGPGFVTTLHGRLDLPARLETYRALGALPLISISDSQRAPLPRANWLATIYHGIDLDAFAFNPDRGAYLAFLGRVSPEKGLDIAIRTARRAGWPLRIAARPPLPYARDPEAARDRAYFEEVIQPLLAEPGIELIGEVGGAAKSTFLNQAAALLFPIRWPEPFGLVMAEALACGTPVVALRAGSVPEVVQDGMTGFVRHLPDDLVDAVDRLAELDRATCRRVAEARFSPAAMADAYERAYARLTRRDPEVDCDVKVQVDATAPAAARPLAVAD
jgi:glycosyltransferase involved in cell wall biosynthesis